MELKIKRNATLADLEQVPEGHNGQLIDGVLYITSRPAIPHAITITGLVNELTPFRKNRALGWILLFEPVLLMGPNVLIGDISGWRRDRLPKIPEGKWFEIAPDFVCEGLSPSTARIDRGQKREIYAKAGVSYLCGRRRRRREGPLPALRSDRDRSSDALGALTSRSTAPGPRARTTDRTRARSSDRSRR